MNNVKLIKINFTDDLSFYLRQRVFRDYQLSP